MTKYHLAEDSKTSISTIFTAASSSELDQISIIKKQMFVFDINNVFICNKEVLSKAIKAIKLLNR